MNTSSIELPMDTLVAFCRRWRITELAIFGSALRPDFRPDSDLDLLVTFADDTSWSLLDQIRMQQELEDLLGRKIDLVSKRAVEQSANWIRRNAILNSAQVIYSTSEISDVTR